MFDTILNASHTLHDTMLERLAHSPVSFFDANPVGRVLNRSVVVCL